METADPPSPVSYKIVNDPLGQRADRAADAMARAAKEMERKTLAALDARIAAENA
jgi:hypothetical protein